MNKFLLIIILILSAAAVQANTSDNLIALINDGKFAEAAAAEGDVNLPAETGDLPLIACVIKGDEALGTAEELIKKGANVNLRDVSGNTPFCEAARRSVSFTRLFLANGGDIASEDAYGRTPLFRAAAAENAEIITLLLDAGSDIHKTDATGNSPLCVIIESDKAELMQLFDGADFNRPTGTDGRLPIELAMLTGKQNILNYLNASGKINYLAVNANGSAVMEAAVESGNSDMCGMILDNGFEINSPVNTKNDTALHTAAGLGRTEIMTMLLDKGADINVRNSGGDTPLMLSLMNPEAAALLVSRGADVNMKNSSLVSPLAAAARIPNRTAQIKLLCDAGADVHARTLEGTTPFELAEKYNPGAIEDMKKSPSYAPSAAPLFAAVSENNIDAAKAVLNSDTVNSSDFGGATPVFYVRSEEMLSLLLDAGADPNHIDHNGRNAEFYAAEGDRVQIASLLISRCGVDSEDYAGQTSLFLAGEKTVGMLTDAGANVNHKSLNGDTPLFYSSKEAAGILIGKGADINVQNIHGETPLYTAVKNNPDKALFLISSGCDVNIPDNAGETPLMYCRDVNTANALIGAGADVDAADKTGRTVLHWLAENSADIEVFKAVISGVRDVNKKNAQGLSPLYYAVCAGRADMCEALINAGAKPDDNENLFANLYLVPETGCHLPITVLLADAGADINKKTVAGSPLLFAAWFGEGDAVSELLSRGADIKNDASPLFAAAKRGRDDIVKLLIDAGGDVNAARSDGTNLLMTAVKYCGTDTVNMLIEKGSDVSAVSKANYTPLHGAVYSSNPAEAASLLLSKGAAPSMTAEGQTPLYSAAMMNKPEMIMILGEAGVELNPKQGDSKTLADICSDMGYAGTAAALKGNNPGEYDKSISSKLMSKYYILSVPSRFEAACVVSALQDALYNGSFEWNYNDKTLVCTVSSSLSSGKVYTKISGLSQKGIFRLETMGRSDDAVNLLYSNN